MAKFYHTISAVVDGFAVYAGGEGIDSRAGHIGHSVTNDPPPAVTFLQSCVVQALNRGDGPASCHTLRLMP